MSTFHNIHNNYAVEINDTQSFLNKEIHAYRSIWRAVITQSLMYASSNSKKLFAKKQKVVALKWLLDEKNNDEFKAVCHLADLDYEKILKQVKMALKRGCRWRNNKSALFLRYSRLYNFKKKQITLLTFYFVNLLCGYSY